MSEEAAVPSKRCPVQDSAASRVNVQLERLKEKMLRKQIIPLFSFQLFALNCNQHDGPASHVDLVTSPVSDLKADGLAHVIAATEALLVQLKKRTE